MDNVLGQVFGSKEIWAEMCWLDQKGYGNKEVGLDQWALDLGLKVWVEIGLAVKGFGQ